MAGFIPMALHAAGKTMQILAMLAIVIPKNWHELQEGYGMSFREGVKEPIRPFIIKRHSVLSPIAISQFRMDLFTIGGGDEQKS